MEKLGNIAKRNFIYVLFFFVLQYTLLSGHHWLRKCPYKQGVRFIGSLFSTKMPLLFALVLNYFNDTSYLLLYTIKIYLSVDKPFSLRASFKI